LVDKHERLGRKNAKGFYDYPPKPAKKKLWPGLKGLYPQLDPDKVDYEELKQRLLVTIALEAARVMEEGIVTDPREADVGSILAFGFAPRRSSRSPRACRRSMARSSRRRSCFSTWPTRAKPSTSASTPTRRARSRRRHKSKHRSSPRSRGVKSAPRSGRKAKCLAFRVKNARSDSGGPT
ncbi:hypothetical protein ACVWO3_29905, partial [Klebsiella pneumoniae]